MKKLLCLMMVAAMAIGLVACGGLSMSDLEGNYEFVKSKEGKTVITAKDLKTFSPDTKVTFEIKDDGKATFDMGSGTKQNMKFDVDKKTVKVDKETNNFTFEDDVLTITSKDKKNMIVFKKK